MLLNPFATSHLSKDKSGCKQKCTQFLTLFSGTVFHALSHGVIRFAWSVSPRNHFLIGGNSQTANQKLLLSWFSKPTLRAKWISPCERAWKTVSESGVRSCVHFCLKSLLHLERCVACYLHVVLAPLYCTSKGIYVSKYLFYSRPLHLVSVYCKPV